MKKLLYSISLITVIAITIAATHKEDNPLTKDFITGNPEIASISRLEFGPEGILFIGDSDNATVYAIDTRDTSSKEKSDRIAVDEFDIKVASALGTTVQNIAITDMAVNPISKVVYFSIHTKAGQPVLLKLVDGELKNVPLDKVNYSKIELADAIAKDAKDRRGRPQRRWAIADMKYHNGKLLLSGLSNKEFSSTFRSIPFPFADNQDFATLEIYHAAHGRYETYAPIKAFDITTINNKEYLLAGYTCTPLVLFPIDDLKGGKHLKGRTIAELGGGNSPIDMISFKKGNELRYFVSNSNRPIMRINFSDIANFKDSMTEPVEEFAKDAGVTYDNLPFVNVQQLDDLDEDNALILRRRNDGHLYLHSRVKKWM